MPPGAGCGQCWLLREVAAYLLTMMAVSGGSHAVILPGVANLHLLLYLHCHACSVWAAAPNAALTSLLPSKAWARFSMVLIPLPGAGWVTPVTEVGSTGGASARSRHHAREDSSRGGLGSSRQDESGPSLESGSSARHPLPPTYGRGLWGSATPAPATIIANTGLGCVRCKHPSVSLRLQVC